MWRTLRDWIHATNGIAIGSVLDAALAVMLAAVAAGSLRLLMGSL